MIDPSIPTTSTTLIHNFHEDDSDSKNSRYIGNKVILCFEEEFTLSDARDWVYCYNQKRGVKLTIVDALPLALFVALFDVDDPVAAKSALLAASPLGVHEVYASVNDFTEDPEHCNLRDFKHLVTVDIPHGTREILRRIEFVVATIGTYVKAKFVSGSVNKHISVVVKSQLKLFPAQGFFRLNGPVVTKICFEYGGRNFRCSYCFSYRHLPNMCPEVKPSFYNVAAIDPAPGIAQARAACSIVAENLVAETLRHPTQTGVRRVSQSSSEVSTFRELSTVPVASSSETRKRHRNRPRSRNREAYARQQSGLREAGEISPIAEEGSLAATLPEVIQSVSGSVALH